jgi:hypothetical protein
MTNNPSRGPTRDVGLYHWSEQEVSIARTLWQHHITDRYGDDDRDIPHGVRASVYRTIAARIKRSADSVEARLKAYGPSFSAIRPIDGRTSTKIPARVLALRDARRDAADQRSLTGQVFGDPPPGFSALDARR